MAVFLSKNPKKSDVSGKLSDTYGVRDLAGLVIL